MAAGSAPLAEAHPTSRQVVTSLLELRSRINSLAQAAKEVPGTGGPHSDDQWPSPPPPGRNGQRDGTATPS